MATCSRPRANISGFGQPCSPIFPNSRELIREPTKEKYKDKVKKKKEGSWDKRFVEYYKRYIEPSINKSGWWTVRRLSWKVSVRIVVGF